MAAWTPLEGEPQLDRLRRERLAKLQALMAEADVAALILIGQSSVTYATGATLMSTDAGRANLQRAVAVVPVEGAPHLCTPWPDGAPPDLPVGHVHCAADTETAAGVSELARLIDEVAGDARSGGSVAVDDWTPAMLFELPSALAPRTLADAGPILAVAKVRKTDDELLCIRRAQRINETAMIDVQPRARPGVRQNELTAAFLGRIRELGATGNVVDPIWQAMPPSIGDGPFTTTGDVAFPLCSTDRVLREGDVVWVDSGISYHGYVSDFGRTWIIGTRASDRQRAQFERWCEVVERVLEVLAPGATAGDLVRAACSDLDPRPWLPHLYLAHGVGTDSAEMPLVGTDLGARFDDALVLAPGMVLVLEPVVWEDGYAGYRAEAIVAVSEDGWVPLSNHPYAPFESQWI